MGVGAAAPAGSVGDDSKLQALLKALEGAADGLGGEIRGTSTEFMQSVLQGAPTAPTLDGGDVSIEAGGGSDLAAVASDFAGGGPGRRRPTLEEPVDLRREAFNLIDLLEACSKGDFTGDEVELRTMLAAKRRCTLAPA